MLKIKLTCIIATVRGQRQLSEMLQLLRILDERPIADPGTEEFKLTKADKVELKIVDNIACFLAPRSTDDILVTLHKDMPLTFVLAKNCGIPDERDKAIAKAFFHAMRDASTWRDVLPCLISNGAERINNALIALSMFQFEGILDGDTPYVPSELHEEFSEQFAERFTSLFDTQDPLEILKGLFHRIRDRASFQVEPNHISSSEELNAQLDKFILVTATAESLLLTKFFTKNEQADWALEYRTRARQVSRYVYGITDLIAFRKRFILAGSDIRYVWLEDIDINEVEPVPNSEAIQLSDSAWTAIQRLSESLQSCELISSDEYHAHPKSSLLEEQWMSTIHPIRHAVPRMITLLDKDTSYMAYPRLIGSSAQLCLCCARWLTEYDDSGGWRTKWMASNPVREIDIGADWALVGVEAPAWMDGEVYEMVLQRVTRVLKDAELLRELHVHHEGLAEWCPSDTAGFLGDMWD